jgi:ketosteroid isomerase-like protein
MIKESMPVDLATARRDPAMSHDNVKRLRMAYEDFNAQGSLPFDLMTDDVEFRQPDQMGGGEGVYRGREGVARGLSELFDVFDDVSCSAEGFIQADNYIVVFVRLCGRAKLSGVPIDAPFAHVWRFRDEQADLWHAYTDRRVALKAVGLDE